MQIDNRFPVLIDNDTTDYSKINNLHLINIVKIGKNNKIFSKHVLQSSLSFTKYQQPINLVLTDLNSKQLQKVFKHLIKINFTNFIFLPFGTQKNDPMIEKILNLFSANQIYCAAPNVNTKRYLFPALYDKVTPVSILKTYTQNKLWSKIKKIDNKILLYKNSKKTVKNNSTVLGAYYFCSNKIKINKLNGVIDIMDNFNFENNTTFTIKKEMMFAFQLSENSITTSELPETVFCDDGFLYGTSDTDFSIDVFYNNEKMTYNFTAVENDVEKEYETFMPWKPNPTPDGPGSGLRPENWIPWNNPPKDDNYQGPIFPGQQA